MIPEIWQVLKYAVNVYIVSIVKGAKTYVEAS